MRRLLWLFPVLACACGGDLTEPGAEPAKGTATASTEPPVSTGPQSSTRCEGEFTATGKMLQARSRAEGVLLADGRVLVAGGVDAVSGAPLASTELFDPASGRWSEAGKMGSPRAGHTLTVLVDGRVLAVGGAAVDEDDSASWTASTELFDPATGSWSAGPALSRVRSGHAAARLSDGSVLVLGGHYGSSSTLERWTPGDAGWRPAGELRFAAMGEKVVTLGDGRTLVLNQQRAAFFDLAANAPGETFTLSLGPNPSDPPMLAPLPSGQLLTSEDSFAIVLDPSARTATQTGTPPSARRNGSAAVLADGRILAVGGETWRSAQIGGTPALTGEVYDEASLGWRPAAQMSVARPERPTVVALADGRAVVTGAGKADTDLYAPGAADACSEPPPPSLWTRSGSLSTARVFAAGASLPDGRVLICGGAANSVSEPLRSCELLAPSTGASSPAGEMLQPRKAHVLLPLHGGQLLAVGGGRADAERYDPGSGTWVAQEPLPASARSAVVLPDGTVVASVSGAPGLLSRAPDSGEWTFHEAGGLIHGALVVRGEELVSFARVPCASPNDPCFFADEYKGVILRRDAGAWVIGAVDESHRRFHPPTLVGLRSGQTLLLAGREITTDEVLSLAPGASLWSATGPLTERHGPEVMATELSSGEVLILGGYEGSEGHDDDWATTAELFAPARGTSQVGEAPFFDRFFGAVLIPLSDGGALLAGGQGVVPSTASQVELYRPRP